MKTAVSTLALLVTMAVVASAHDIKGKVVKTTLEPEVSSSDYGYLTVKLEKGSYVRVVLPRENTDGVQAVSEVRALQVLNHASLGQDCAFSDVALQSGYKNRYLFHVGARARTFNYGVSFDQTKSSKFKVIVNATLTFDSDTAWNWGWMTGRTKKGSYIAYFLRKDTFAGEAPLSEIRAATVLNPGILGHYVQAKYTNLYYQKSNKSYTRYLRSKANVEIR